MNLSLRMIQTSFYNSYYSITYKLLQHFTNECCSCHYVCIDTQLVSTNLEGGESRLTTRGEAPDLTSQNRHFLAKAKTPDMHAPEDGTAIEYANLSATKPHKHNRTLRLLISFLLVTWQSPLNKRPTIRSRAFIE